MIHTVLGWCSLVLLVAGVALLVLGLRRQKSALRICCPGPRPRLLARLNPLGWVFRRACWYNLTGLPLNEQGAVRCPECGTATRPQRFLRDGRRWRPHAAGAMVLAVSLTWPLFLWVSNGQWVRVVPTLVLVGFERLGPRWQPRPMRWELYSRVTNAQVSGFSARWLIPKLVNDLANDKVRWNAQRAWDMLDSLRAEAGDSLEAALASSDLQTRKIAAALLRNHQSDNPSDALLRACIEDLRDDGRTVDYPIWCWNAFDAVTYLIRFPQRAEPLLDAALDSNDPQQRLLAACIAGRCGLVALLGKAAPILIDNLRDDNINGNAKAAAPALYHFGPPIIPYLEPYCDDPDTQLRTTARALVERLRFPGRPLSQLKNPLPRITEVTDDPLTLSVWPHFADFP